jgi:hypothetical protein
MSGNSSVHSLLAFAISLRVIVFLLQALIVISNIICVKGEVWLWHMTFLTVALDRSGQFHNLAVSLLEEEAPLTTRLAARMGNMSGSNPKTKSKYYITCHCQTH